MKPIGRTIIYRIFFAILICITLFIITLFFTHSKTIIIYKVIPRIIRRIYVYHLDSTIVILAKQLQHFQIFTLNIKVFCSINIFTILWNKFQCLSNNIFLRNFLCILLTSPSQLIFLTIHLYKLS